MRHAAPLLLLVVTLVSACGDERGEEINETSLVPRSVSVAIPEGAELVGLGGTLVGGRLYYGNGLEEGRRAARVDIARGRPQNIGYGIVAWHHSGVDTENGLPNVCGWDVLTEGSFAFYRGYNEVIGAALESGEIKPPEQMDEGSHFFTFVNLLADGVEWPELEAGRNELGEGVVLRLDPHPDDEAYGYLSVVGVAGDATRFAFVRRPVQVYLPANGKEIVLREPGVMRVFHRVTGVLLRAFPHHKRDVEEILRLRAERAKRGAEGK